MVESTAGRSNTPPRTLARAAPWALSLIVHAALILLGFMLTWTIIRLEDRPPSPVVEAGLPAPALAAVTEVRPIELPGPGPAPSPPAPVPDVVPDPPPRSAEPPISMPGAAQPALPLSTVFAGSDLPLGDVVFVIDASGTMIPWFHDVVGELDRSLRGMRPTDEFAVVLFRGSEAIVAWPGRPCPAQPRYREQALAFLRDYTRWGGPALGSDPVAALQTALAFDPSTIVLLSGGMDASTSYSLDTREVLEALAAASDMAARSGSSATIIRCVQLVPDASVAPDPLLSAIASMHGGDSVHLVTHEELDP